MRFSFLIILSVFIQLGASPQEKVDKEGLTSKLREIRSAVELLSSSDESVIKERNSLRLLINDIILRLDEFKDTFPQPYATSLTHLLFVSREISKSSNSIEQKNVLGLIFKDLQIKFKHRTNTLGGELFNDLLPVTVICKRKGAYVNNLRIRYAALGYAINTSNPDGSFQTLTSPASDKLVPGIYKLWATEDGKFTVLQSWSGELSPEKDNKIQLDLQ